jgi:dTDP-L-rhamnose 4-epimerase
VTFIFGTFFFALRSRMWGQEQIKVPTQVLITGGAGFIGSHITDLLLASGYRVRILDMLHPQVHRDGARPSYLSKDAELIVGDVRDESVVHRALKGIDSVIHLASAVGVGQSMYEIASYTASNDLGTAVLLEALSRHPVDCLVCASSMSVYGEGLGRRKNGEYIAPIERRVQQLRQGQWEPMDDTGIILDPVPTPENKQVSLGSIYALTKYVQERQCLIVGKAYGIPTLALRFFNVYGPRQALSNPYTGVLAIFAARLLNKKPPLVFEDGAQRRDFVHVSDIAYACKQALETKNGHGEVFNIGSGEDRTILSIAQDLARVVGHSIEPRVTGKYRAGDIRHCFADTSKAARELGYRPRIDFESGLRDFAQWIAEQNADDFVEYATSELETRGLVA